MEQMIVVFRARSQTINFANILKSYRVNCSIINTPRQINVSCGILVKFNYADLRTVEDILARRKFDTFAGIYKLEFVNGLLRSVRVR